MSRPASERDARVREARTAARARRLRSTSRSNVNRCASGLRAARSSVGSESVAISSSETLAPAAASGGKASPIVRYRLAVDLSPPPRISPPRPTCWRFVQQLGWEAIPAVRPTRRPCLSTPGENLTIAAVENLTVGRG